MLSTRLLSPSKKGEIEENKKTCERVRRIQTIIDIELEQWKKIQKGEKKKNW